MKHFKSIIIIALLALPFTAQAQKNIESAIKKFVKEVKPTSFISKSKLDYKENLKIYCNIYKFRLPNNEFRRVQQLEEAFNKDDNNAYNTIHRNGTEGNGVASIVYAKHIRTIIGEHYDNVRLACYEDVKDSTMRYAYSLEWDTPKGNDSIRGKIIETYDVRPVGNKETDKEIFKKMTFPTLGYSFLEEKPYVVQNIEKAISQDEVEEILAKQKAKSKDWEEDVNKIIRESSPQYKVNDQLLRSQEMGSSVWLSTFYSMKQLVEKYPDANTTSYYISTIYDLCKHSSQLDDNERKLVQGEIGKLTKLVKDDFLKSLLKNSADFLNK